MACAGIDFGNKTSVVAIARRGGIDICSNDVSNRATPTMVSFQGNARSMGEGAATIAAQNHRNTVASLQRLLGVPRTEQFVELESRYVTCPLVADPATGLTAAKVSYSGLESDTGEEIFSMQAVVAMLLTNLMATASNEYKAPVRDLVISVPVYYTEAQRRALLDAAAIANVNVLRVINEHAATALSYGIFRTKDLPETTPIKVAFVDIGEATTTVSISAFTKTRCDVLSVVSDASLGGRNLDDIIFTEFAAAFKTKYGIDVAVNPKPAVRLRKECEKVKKVLSTNPGAPVNIECLMDDLDVKGHIKREELEAVATPLLERIRKMCETAVADANLKDGEKLAAVEIVGGSTRVPAFKEVITKVFAKYGAPLRTTLNADECIARGCALMSAMLSPAFKVRDYIMSDINTMALDAEKVFTNGTPNEVFTLVPKKNPMPCLKALTFRSPGPLTLNIRYNDPSTLPICKEQPHICGYLLDAPLDPEAKVRTKVRLTANGTVEIASATLIKEIEEEELVEVKKEEKANGTAGANNAAPASTTTPAPETASSDPATATPATEAAPVKRKTDPVPNGNATTADTPMTEADEPDVQMSDTPPSSDGPTNPASDTPVEPSVTPGQEPDSKKEPTKQEAPPVYETRMVKKTKHSDVQVTPLPGIGYGLTTDMVTAATEKEAKMRANDLYVKERSEARNALEAFVYDLRSRIDDSGGDLKEFGSGEFRVALKKELDMAEEWIYSDEADQASKSAFVEKTTYFRNKADPMMKRKRETAERSLRINALEATIQEYKQVCVPGVLVYEHIPDTEKEKILKCVEGAYLWLKDLDRKQRTTPGYVDPVLTCQMLIDKKTEIDGICRPIEQTPKPAPKEEEKKPESQEEAPKPKEEEKKPESQEEALKPKPKEEEKKPESQEEAV